MMAPRIARICVLSLVLFAGFVAMQPSSPQASTYLSALDNFAAPTAASVGCQWGEACYGGMYNGYCGPGTEPEFGCLPKPTGCLWCAEP